MPGQHLPDDYRPPTFQIDWTALCFWIAVIALYAGVIVWWAR